MVLLWMSITHSPCLYSILEHFSGLPGVTFAFVGWQVDNFGIPPEWRMNHGNRSQC
jgi:hypothetical protein